MFSRILLVLAGVFAGMWVRDGRTTLFDLGVPWLALLALLLAIAAEPRVVDVQAKARLEQAYRDWLDAWRRSRTAAPERERALSEDLESATHMIALTANERIVKSLQHAREQDLSAPAVAQLVLDMRRSLRTGGVMLKTADLEAFLAPAAKPVATRHGSPAPASVPASFLG